MRLYLSSFRLGNRPEKLLELLAGKRQTALISNAMDFVAQEDRATSMAQEIDRLKDIGLDPVELDLRHYFGKHEKLKKDISKFDLIWTRGGNAFVLRRAFKQSGFDEIVKNLLNDDVIVYGGYSAGIDMLTPSLHGAELVDDPNIIPEGYETRIVWECLNILPYSIAPHYKSDHPESVAIDKSVEYLINNHIFFIALRDGEAIIRNGDQEIVVS